MPRIEPVPTDQLSPRARTLFDEGMGSGAYVSDHDTGDLPSTVRTLAWSAQALEAAHSNSMKNWPPGLLGSRLKDLVRIRSAQVNGCDHCAAAVKDEDVSGEDAVCLIETDYSSFSPREAAALRFVTKFGTDHRSIGDADIIGLLAEFSPAEVVELIHYAGMMMGTHRMYAVLGVALEETPVIRFTPDLVNAPKTATQARLEKA